MDALAERGYRRARAAQVRRQRVHAGLAELEAVDQNSPTHDLLNDYSVFFVNYR
jgi:hypothetical protein